MLEAHFVPPNGAAAVGIQPEVRVPIQSANLAIQVLNPAGQMSGRPAGRGGLSTAAVFAPPTNDQPFMWVGHLPVEMVGGRRTGRLSGTSTFDDYRAFEQRAGLDCGGETCVLRTTTP